MHLDVMHAQKAIEVSQGTENDLLVARNMQKENACTG